MRCPEYGQTGLVGRIHNIYCNYTIGNISGSSGQVSSGFKQVEQRQCDDLSSRSILLLDTSSAFLNLGWIETLIALSNHE